MDDTQPRDTVVSELRLVVTTEDYDAAVRCYRDALGLHEVHGAAVEGGRVTVLDAGRARVELVDPGQPPTMGAAEVERPSAREVHVAFEVPDCAVAAERLTAAGATVSVPETATSKGSRMRLEGPAGLGLALFSTAADPSSRVVVTVIGQDRIGIIAAVATILAAVRANILDLDQGIVGGLFVMTMMVDLADATVSFDELRDRLHAAGVELGLQVEAQHEDVFKYMHRV